MASIRPFGQARPSFVLQANDQVQERNTSLLVFAAVLSSTVIFSDSVEAQKRQPSPQMPHTSPAERVASFVTEAAQRFAIPEAWIRAVMHVESAGDLRATSPKGAMGLMQIMPETYADLRTRHQLGTNPYNPHDNILAGAAYLREMHDRFGSVGFLAAYNAGPLRYEDHLTTGRPLPKETRDYVATLNAVLGLKYSDDSERVRVAAADANAWTHGPLFIVKEIFTQLSALPGDKSDNASSLEQHSSGRSSTRSVVDMTALAPQSHGLFVRVNSTDARH